MASTNKTTHYELSQYVGTDKPTYLTDYNQDMSRIDAGIYGAKSLADVNETAIGDLTNLTTTAKTNLVSAINELDGEVATNTANISTNTSNISTNATNIGNLNNLTTASKTNLVGAINEVDANSDSNSSAIGDLNNLTTTAKNNLVVAINEVLTKLNSQPDMKLTSVTSYNVADYVTSGGVQTTGLITIARNNDGSVAKIYGNFNDTSSSGAEIIITIPNTGLTPTSEFTISDCGIGLSNVNGSYKYMRRPWIVCKTNGTVEVHSWPGVDNINMGVILFNSIYFIKDFGDTPSPQ